MPGMGVLVHTGRKTRRRYRTPVNVFRREDNLIIAWTYGRQSHWVQNVLANGGGELERQGQTVRVSEPHLFHDDEHTTMPALVRPFLRLLNVSDFLEVKVEK